MINMSTPQKNSFKSIIFIIIILILPSSSLIYLLLYRAPRNYPAGFVNNIINETAEYALTFQTQDGLFIEPTIDILFNAVATYYYLNDSYPFNSSLLDYSYISRFVLTRQNSDGGFSDFAGSGNILSTFQVLKIANWTIPINSNSNGAYAAYSFVNSSQLSDGGYTLRPPYNLPSEFNLDLGSSIPTSNLTIEPSNIKNTYESLEILSLVNKTPSNVPETVNFINNSIVGCRRELGLAAGFAATKYTIIPDLHSTYYAVSSLINLGFSKNDINKFFSNVSLFVIACYNPIEGGFAMYPGNASDITSTLYGLSTLHLLESNLPLANLTKTLNFIKYSQNDDGGFGSRNATPSSYQSSHHAVASLNLLDASLPAENLSNLYNWFSAKQAINDLFGEMIVEAQYWGIKSAEQAGNYASLNHTKLAIFLISCQNLNGGFGTKPNAKSTIIDTYCAIESLAVLSKITSSDLFQYINRTTAIQWLQQLQTTEGGFTSEISLNAFLSSYGSFYGAIAELILNESRPSTQATLFALAALRRLNSGPLDQNTLRLWLLSNQNADGGFPFSPGIKSDAISTFYALQALELINRAPYSPISCKEFLLGCQMSDGGFTFYPLIGEYLNLSYLFITFTASKALYLLNTQPSNVKGAMDWFLNCQDNITKGFGDAPYFGADLRNSPYLIDIAWELNIDRSFDPAPWIKTVIWLFGIELILLSSLLIIRMRRKYRKATTSTIQRSYPHVEEYPAVHVKGLTIKIGKKVILEDVNMTLQDGEVLGVIGESGAGKSTFVKCILGTKASIGEVNLFGFDIRKQKKRLKPLFGYVPQDLSKIYENFTVMENLLHFGKQYNINEKQITERGNKILQDLGLLNKKNSLVSELSGGQRRRASIAVGMIHQPKLFVLDEPTSGLDPIIREQLWISLLDLAERHGSTLIVITHYPEESKFCTRVAIFGRKRGLIDFGHPRELLANLPGKGRAIDIILDDTDEKTNVDLLPILKKISQIEFLLEEKKGSRYRLFTNLPVATIKDLLAQVLGTQSFTVKQSESTLIDYFRIKSLEVQE